MKKSVAMLCAGVAVATVGTTSKAMDLGQNFYGKVNVGLGYNLQGYQGDIKDLIDEAKNANVDTNKYNHGITISGGYNVYYKWNQKLFGKTIHPFVGADVTVKIPVAGQKIVDMASYELFNEDGDISEEQEGATYKFGEYFMFHVKAGAKMEITKDWAVSPYYMLGFNVTKFKVDDESKTKAGLSTGIGAEVLFKEKYSAAIEYRYTLNKFTDKKVETNNMMLKLGYHFL